VTPAAPRRLTLYHRRDCHLCEVMRAEVEAACAGHPIVLDLVDVDADAALAARYGSFVPVLCIDEREVSRYRLDPDALAAALG
jgi:hypothetical protein